MELVDLRICLAEDRTIKGWQPESQDGDKIDGYSSDLAGSLSIKVASEGVNEGDVAYIAVGLDPGHVCSAPRSDRRRLSASAWHTCRFARHSGCGPRLPRSHSPSPARAPYLPQGSSQPPHTKRRFQGRGALLCCSRRKDFT